MPLCHCLFAGIIFIAFHTKIIFQEKGKAIGEILQSKIHCSSDVVGECATSKTDSKYSINPWLYIQNLLSVLQLTNLKDFFN